MNFPPATWAIWLRIEPSEWRYSPGRKSTDAQDCSWVKPSSDSHIVAHARFESSISVSRSAIKYLGGRSRTVAHDAADNLAVRSEEHSFGYATARLVTVQDRNAIDGFENLLQLERQICPDLSIRSPVRAQRLDASDRAVRARNPHGSPRRREHYVPGIVTQYPLQIVAVPGGNQIRRAACRERA